MTATESGRPLRLFLIAGEQSGDSLGAGLMRELARQSPVPIDYSGVGGRQMEAAGLSSLFPLSDISIIGISGVLAGLPRILSRIRMSVDRLLADPPDALVIIDSPDFTHRVARAVRRRAPDVPIIDYVSPTVWAWRPGRAAAMRRYVDHVLAVLPFEPEVHRRLGGPPCTYVGHPLIEQLVVLRPGPDERRPIAAADPVQLLVLPGSRSGEVRRHMATFGAALSLIADASGPLQVTLPAVDQLAEPIAAAARAWPVPVEIVVGAEAKHAAFRRAHAALAASGTVTLELALSGVPMSVAYNVDRVARLLKPLVKVDSIVLPNLILGENAIPEFVLKDFRPETMAAAVVPLLADTPERARQITALDRLDALMVLPDGRQPSEAAAAVVLAEINRAGLL